MGILNLSDGDYSYKSYIGMPSQYDIIGALQFRLLCTLGLRANHRVLDFGCGSLRAGRLFIIYLDEGHYYGIEPNKWLIQEAIKNQLGQDIVRIKRPLFAYNADFSTQAFSTKFDFIILHSIFTHTGSDITKRCLMSLKGSLKEDGIIAATFLEGNSDFKGNGWVYPRFVTYSPSTIQKVAENEALFVLRIPWYHPRQTWYLFAKNKKRLPCPLMLQYLQGAILADPEFKASWNKGASIRASFLRSLKKRIPHSVKKRIKALNKYKWLST